jgi:hypothetical protein
MREPVPTAPKTQAMSVREIFQALVQALVKHGLGKVTPRALWLLGGPPPPDASTIGNGKKLLPRLNQYLAEHGLRVSYKDGTFTVKERA